MRFDARVSSHIVRIGNRELSTLPNWKQDLTEAFNIAGACRLAALSPHTLSLRSELVKLTVTPVSVGVLQFYPVVIRVEHIGHEINVDLTLREHA
jgi:hypothetical protein